MADVFYTILIAWVLWKIFGGASVKTYSHQQSNNQPPQKKEGEVTVSYDKKTGKPKSENDGEYVDYEEVK